MTAANATQLLVPRYAVKVFREEQHPRDQRGRFTRKPAAGLARAAMPGSGGRRLYEPSGAGMRDGRRFASNREGVEWADRHLPDPSLTEDEFATLNAYTGARYVAINDALRDPSQSDEAIEEQIATIRAAIAKAPAPEAFTVFRGSPPRIVEEMIGPLGQWDDDVRLQELVGRTFDVRTFHSTSIGVKSASSFEKADVQWMIKIPQGQPALWLESGISKNQGEREVLLPPDTRRVIHAVYRNPDDPNDDRIYVEVEVVPSDWTPPEGWAPQPAGDAHVGYGEDLDVPDWLADIADYDGEW